MYFNYVDFCSKNKMMPVNAASFGKVKYYTLLIFYTLILSTSDHTTNVSKPDNKKTW